MSDDAREACWAAGGVCDPDELLAARAASDQQAFVALYERYAPRIHRYVLARGGNPRDLEDVTSAIWMRVYSRIHLYRPERGSFASWLFTLARNVLQNVVRQRVRTEVSMLSEIASSTPGPEALVLGREAGAEVRRAVSRLTREQQEAVALRYAAELSFAEIGQALGKSEAAAKMLVRRGIEGLRRQLEEEVDRDARPRSV